MSLSNKQLVLLDALDHFDIVVFTSCDDFRF